MKKVEKSTLSKHNPAVAQALPLDENLLQRKHVSEESYACAIRVLRFSWRQGTVSCKTRGELAFSNRKPWKQKGTGRARVGSIRSPLWRKGAVLFGPQPRTRKLTIPRDQKKSLMNALFFTMYDKDAIACLDFPATSGPVKTKHAWDILNRHNFVDKKVILFLTTHDAQMQAAFRNIPSVHIIYYDQPNVYALSSGTHWLFLRKDAMLFTRMVEQWK